MRIVIAIGVLFAGIVLPTTLGLLWPDYNPLSDYLSELGATGAPHAAIMNYAGFLPLGALWALGLFSLLAGERSKALVAGVILLLGTTVSYLGAAAFHCDAGCPMEGSSSQMMHNSLGVIGYLTAPWGLALIGWHYVSTKRAMAGVLSFVAAAATLTGFLMMANPEMDALKGAWQRLADFSLFVWLMTLSVSLRKRV
jgi:hypothetical membrane protein